MTGSQKLIALDDDDLAVISAHVQDATVRIRDIIWRQEEKRLVVGLNRLDWESAISGEIAPRRLMSALRFDRVLSCQSRNIDLGTPDRVIELLGVEFRAGKAPGGSVLLIFADRGALRVEIECLECELADFGPEDQADDEYVAEVGVGVRIA